MPCWSSLASYIILVFWWRLRPFQVSYTFCRDLISTLTKEITPFSFGETDILVKTFKGVSQLQIHHFFIFFSFPKRAVCQSLDTRIRRQTFSVVFGRFKRKRARKRTKSDKPTIIRWKWLAFWHGLSGSALVIFSLNSFCLLCIRGHRPAGTNIFSKTFDILFSHLAGSVKSFRICILRYHEDRSCS